LSGGAKRPDVFETFEWKPEEWRRWRELDTPYRRLKNERDRRLAVDLLQPAAGEAVLEVGCGFGWVTEALLATAPIRWTGVDRSAAMLTAVRSRPALPAHRVLLADARRLPFADGAFDKVLCNGVLTHIRDDRAALRELARVLRPCGRLVVSMNSLLSPYAGPVIAHNRGRMGFVQHFRLPSTYRRWLRALGLQIRAQRGDGVFATVGFRLGRLRIPPERLFPAVRALDARLVDGIPGFAHEVWFAAVKPVANGGPDL
jgi:SAM-dependent methyltransferase